MAKKTVQIKDKTRAAKIRKILKTTYPHAKTQLRYDTPFELLVATILSAQCTDKQVNGVTGDLFKKLKTPDDFAGAPNEIIEALIRSTGYFRNKAKNIKNCSKSLMENYNGKVPRNLDELVKLPGVGRKTANVIASVVFNKPAMAVDTHVFRVSARIGLTTNSKTPLETEKQLVRYIPTEKITTAHHWLILHGRYTCKARKPMCDACGLTTYCKYYAKMS